LSSDDAQSGKLAAFPQAGQLKDEEVNPLAWVVYRNKTATASTRR
jgi:uncharacterized protein YbaA (DUF1428 family)